jgi:hypothetical protein
MNNGRSDLRSADLRALLDYTERDPGSADPRPDEAPAVLSSRRRSRRP